MFSLSEVSTSHEVLNIEVEKKPNVVDHAQTSYSPGVSWTPWSLNMWDNQRSTPVSPQKPKRYALQIWLEVEVEPGYFVPPEDDSCSTDFALEVLNCTYPGCTGVYLDRAGHMLAFYGRKGGSKAGLIQEVAIEAGRAVTEIPTWMGARELKVGVSVLPGTTHLPAPTLWPLSYCCFFPATGCSTNA